MTAAFGFRNLANYEDGLREISGVAAGRDGGDFGIYGAAGWADGDLYRWYFRRVLPRIGGCFRGSRGVYVFAGVGGAIFSAGAVGGVDAAVGYSGVEYRVWTLGTVALHTGNGLKLAVQAESQKKDPLNHGVARR